jgi:PAS domain S-box-containing protein
MPPHDASKVSDAANATARRLDALREYAILDTPPEQAFDDIVQLAAEICDAPIALVSLVEADRQWFKAVVGLDLRQTPIEQSVCARILDETGVVVVPDTRADPRLLDNSLVTGTPGLRFYAGAVLATENDVPLGTLCVLDYRPRAEGLSDRQRAALAKLGRQVMAQMELRKIARELRDREARLYQVTEAMPQMVWAGDADGALDYFNRRCTEYTGLAAGELNGERWAAMLHPDDAAESRRRWRQAVAAREAFEVEYRLRAADGSYRWFLGRAEPVLHPDTGAVSRWFGSSTDIDAAVRARTAERDAKAVLEQLVAARTRELADSNARLVVAAEQRARAEEALRQSQKMEALGQLTGGIAHDFNNLLTGILGALELVRMRIAAGNTGNVDRFVLAAMMAANRAATLTQRMLTFARRQDLAPRPVAIDLLVGSMEEFIRRTVGEAITVTLVQGEAVWPALCDPNQLENALLNLAINARDAMPSGGTLAIETGNAVLDPVYAATQADLAPGDYVRITVRDSGTGMSPEVLERAMEPFFTTKPQGQGTGLGMSMLYGFVAQSRGHVRLASRPGEGTVVTVYLPRSHELPSLDAVGPEPRSAPAEAPAQGGTVLIVEDDATVRMLIRERLAEAGYAAIEAADGQAGLRVVDSRARIDLLVTDIGLPGLDGRVLAARARELRPALKVLFITGYGTTFLPPDGMLADGMRMIGKPFSLAELDAEIRALTG